MRPQQDPSTCREFVWDDARGMWSRCAHRPVGQMRHPETGTLAKVCQAHADAWTREALKKARVSA